MQRNTQEDVSIPESVFDCQPGRRVLKRNVYGTPTFWTIVGEVLLELGWEEVPKWECMFISEKKGLFLSRKRG